MGAGARLPQGYYVRLDARRRRPRSHRRLGEQLRRRSRAGGGRDRSTRRLRGLPGADDQRLGLDVAPNGRRRRWPASARRSTPTGSDAFVAKRPTMVPMVVDPAEGGPASHASADAWEFFTGQKLSSRGRVALSQSGATRSRCDRSSCTRSTSRAPSSKCIVPIPPPMILGDADVVCPTDSGSTCSTGPKSSSGSSCIRAVTSRGAYTHQFAACRWRGDRLGSTSTCDPGSGQTLSSRSRRGAGRPADAELVPLRISKHDVAVAQFGREVLFPRGNVAPMATRRSTAAGTLTAPKSMCTWFSPAVRLQYRHELEPYVRPADRVWQERPSTFHPRTSPTRRRASRARRSRS